ncbi:hypothetical protein BJV77DRAFT_987552 [Russula vinacea]|nr:hypothetical protein BJV77DRAFT_987552 [Russula vinacea]
MLTEENRHVTRAFYDPRFIVVMDQLARHQVLKDDDLAGRVGLQVKELNKHTATLEKDGLIQTHRQNELKQGAQRSVGRQYFYVDYKRFCNVVKWRVAEMHRVIDTGLRNQLDNKGYIYYERGVFICEDCGTELVDNENAENVRGSQDRMQRFNYQMRFIREGLRKARRWSCPTAGEPGHGLKVAGSTGERQQEDGIGIVERLMEAAAKKQQNIMPLWHLRSTITDDLTALGIKENAQIAANQEEADEDAKQGGTEGNEADCKLRPYYASLAASAAPSTQHTPPGEKPNIEYLDALNEHNKRSRSVENEGKAERKQARVEDGWGLQGAQENGELSMNGTESLGVNAEDLPTEDPMVYVDGKPMPFSQVGEEHHDLMTADEYAAYFEIFQQRSA